MPRKAKPAAPGAPLDTEAMIRVDHAGEYGAVRIYQGQLAVLRKGAAAAIALVAGSGLIGAYHTGMEWKIFPGPTTCTGPRFELGGPPVPVVRCDVAIPVFLGQSLAFWNALISLGVAGIAAFLLARINRAA